MRKAPSVAIAVITSVASLIAIAETPATFWRSLYPLAVIGLLTGLLLASWIYIAMLRTKPTEADRHCLDRLLAALPREAIRRLEGEDFIAPWRERSVYPAIRYVEEFGGREDHFDSRALEKCRVRLYDTADRFIWAEAKNGFAHELRAGLRNTGWLSGELEIDDEKLAIAEQRAETIRSPARELIAAHEALVALAKRRRFDLTAIASDLPISSWEAEETVLANAAS